MTANENNTDRAKPRLRPIYVQMGPQTPKGFLPEVRESLRRGRAHKDMAARKARPR